MSKDTSILKEKKTFPIIRVVLKILLLGTSLILLAGIAIGSYIFYKAYPTLKQYWDDAEKLVTESTPNTFKLHETSYIYASDSTQLVKLKQDTDCEYVEYEDLPENVIDAFIAIEDKRFYEHDGVDWLSTLKAAYLLFRDDEISRGGSTITQQLARNVFVDIGFETSYERKIKEIFTALHLERKYSKKQILEYYINNINYGNGYYGIGSAAHGYFDRSVSELSYEEVALLCAIPNNPTYYNPRKNLKHAISRRNIILREMYEQNYITKKEYLHAVNSSITLAKVKTDFYNYESSYAIHCSVLYLMKLSGFSFQYSFDSMQGYSDYRSEYEEAYSLAKTKLYTGGFHIYTTLNLRVQKKVQKIIDQNMAAFTAKTKDGTYEEQAAATVINNQTGKVVAIIGGRSQKSIKNVYSLNRAYQGYKQPGSTIKPLIVYTPSLERGYTADTLVNDTYFEGGPKNSDGNYAGSIPLRVAVEKSKNVVAWRLFSELTPQVGLKYLQQMHFDKITPNDYYVPAALGGLYYGVTTEQMASAYSALANEGSFSEPDCLVSILDSDGRELYKKSKTVQIYDKKAARSMLDILKGVSVSGTASGLSLASNPTMPIACKTGTTNEQACAWFCGVTPYYSCAVYVGADTNISIDGLWGNTYPKYIWADIQDYLCRGKSVRDFYKVSKKKSTKQGIGQSTEQTLDQSAGESIGESTSLPSGQDAVENAEPNTGENTEPSAEQSTGGNTDQNTGENTATSTTITEQDTESSTGQDTESSVDSGTDEIGSFVDVPDESEQTPSESEQTTPEPEQQPETVPEPEQQPETEPEPETTIDPTPEPLPEQEQEIEPSDSDSTVQEQFAPANTTVE